MLAAAGKIEDAEILHAGGNAEAREAGGEHLALAAGDVVVVEGDDAGEPACGFAEPVVIDAIEPRQVHEAHGRATLGELLRCAPGLPEQHGAVADDEHVRAFAQRDAAAGRELIAVGQGERRIDGDGREPEISALRVLKNGPLNGLSDLGAGFGWGAGLGSDAML